MDADVVSKHDSYVLQNFRCINDVVLPFGVTNTYTLIQILKLIILVRSIFIML